MRPMLKRCLGISIQGEKATFVELAGLMGGVRLLRAGTVALPQGESGEPQSLEERTEARQSQPEAQAHPSTRPPEFSKATRVVLGIPRRSVVVRLLEVPAVEEKDLAGLMTYEVERHLPFPVEEACYSFQPLKVERGKVKILLTAARRADLERHLEALGRLGLVPTSVDVSAFAAVNAVARAWRRERGKVLCLLELDGECAEVSLMRDGLLLSSRAIPISGGSAESLRRELERTSAEGIAPPAKVLVSGGSEQDCRHLTEGLGVPAEPWSPGPSPVSASGYGLALKGLRSLPLQVDLLPPERRKIRRDRSVLAMVTLLALSGVLAGTLVVHRGYQERTTLDLLKARAAAVKAQADEVDALQKEFTHLRRRLQVLEGIAQERGRSLIVWRELADLLPTDVALTELALEGNRLQIRGSIAAAPSTLISAFERSALFENAAFTSPISAQGKDRQGFHLQAQVKDSEQRSVGSGQPSASSRQGTAANGQGATESRQPAAGSPAAAAGQQAEGSRQPGAIKKEPQK